MEKPSTRLPHKLLVNAEAFGFGPTAAIADIFPYLRREFAWIGYVGTGHSLDLQRNAGYDAVYDLTDSDDEHFDEIVQEHDLFFTALNFARAERAVRAGVPTAIYDPLTWYWRDIPPVLSENVLYLAQAFHGVYERLHEHPDAFRNPHVVSPLVPQHAKKGKRHILLVNLGGLQNPFWGLDLVCAYANTIVECVRTAVDGATDVVVACSQRVAKALPELDGQTFSREAIVDMLPHVKVAFQTPGLANIYDAAAFDVPTLFLPPANDSQGQQLRHLLAHQHVDAAVDWPDLDPNWRVDYCDSQQKVLQILGRFIDEIETPAIKQRLVRLFQAGMTKILWAEKSKVSGLIDQYGRAGAQQVAKHLIAYARTLSIKELSHA